MVTFLVVTAILLSTAASLNSAVGTSTTYPTLIPDLTAVESLGMVEIKGTLQYERSPINGTLHFSPLSRSAVNLYWSTSNSTPYTLIDQEYTDDNGVFSLDWVHGLEPGHYFVEATYGGGSVGNLTFIGCAAYKAFNIELRLAISVDKPTVSVDNSGQGGSATLAVTASAANSKTHPSVSLSITNLANLLGDGINGTFTHPSGSTPLLSNLKLDFSNTTQAGTYTIVITATSDDDSSISQSINVYAYVQQMTRTITVEVQGLSSGISTSLYIDGTAIENIGTGTIALTISNKTKTISVLKEIPSGNTRYLCDDYTQPADLSSTGSFVFKYVTEYTLKISGDLPPNIVCKLILNVDDADKSDSAFKPAQGYTGFLPKDANLTFGISPEYITTTQVNYRFREWKERISGQTIGMSNSTADGLFVVRLSTPMDLRAYYDKWVTVTIRTNLPSELSTNLQIGLVGSEKKNVPVTGSVAYKAGEFLAGAAFECDIAQDQLVLYNAEGNIRYEFQGMSPSSPLSLDQHTTISINYTSKYRVQVTSRFPDTVIQPPGGVGWYSPGQIATLQVMGDAKDKYGIPYTFDRWSGAVSSNETTVSFPVVTPVEIEAQWKLNWMYLLTLGGGFFAVAVPSAIVVKKKVLVRVRWPRKALFKKRADSQGDQSGLTDDDMQVYNYIMTKGGSLKMSEAAADLEMSREAIMQSVEKLRKKDLLH
jgi:hypothetical protein